MTDVKVTATAADREAAAERLTPNGENCPINHTIAQIRAGRFDDHSWVQAFARFNEAKEAAKGAAIGFPGIIRAIESLTPSKDQDQ